MRKFKVGDRVRVRRGGRMPFDGKVSHILPEINGRCGGIGVIEDGFYSVHDESPFHPKQCRRLVKKRKMKNEPV